MLLVIIFGIYQRGRHLRWGIVYDSKTKKPLSKVVVRIYDNRTDRLVDQKITDESGRYGFLVLEGEYLLSADRTGYTFPTTLITAKNDPPFRAIYHGENILKDEFDIIISADIPMDRV